MTNNPASNPTTSERIGVPLASDEREAIERFAAQHNISLSDVGRSALLHVPLDSVNRLPKKRRRDGVLFRVTDEQHEAVRRTAYEHRLTVAAVGRSLILQYISDPDAPAPTTTKTPDGRSTWQSQVT